MIWQVKGHFLKSGLKTAVDLFLAKAQITNIPFTPE
jgi:hypothetical protein